MHENREIHRDVKASHILLSTTGNVKLDFSGGATSLIQLRNEALSIFGDATYMAPEILKSRSGYTEKTDFWGLGLTVIYFATGKMPFAGQKFLESLARIID